MLVCLTYKLSFVIITSSRFSFPSNSVLCVCCCNQPDLEQQPGMAAEAGFDNPMYGTGALQEVHHVLAFFRYRPLW